MRLSSLKLAGFKSFVDPTTLPLPSNLTSVVGPNGCGKSNIIDAVRWVLGETSIKNLRGADSEDVIFNGSKSRKPVSKASVELVFDNSDQQIVGPYAAYTDIAVRRELTRDGSSQYFLNGRKCLKRDVTDLFLGTGLGGKNQYAIIEQGMVSRMVEAKPDELRQWLEEAAGISKYKERRRETENRIKQTRENLSRLNDMRSELLARIDLLTKQASNAQKYTELKSQERQLRTQILCLRVQSLAGSRAEKQAAISAQELTLEARKAQLLENIAARAQAEATLQAAAETVNQHQAAFYDAEAVLARAEQALKHALELQQLRETELSQLQRQLSELHSREQREQSRLAALQTEVHHLAQQLNAAEQLEGDALAAASKADTHAANQQQAWHEHLQRSEQPLAQVEAERVRVQQLDRAKMMLDERLKRLETERAGLNPTPIQASMADADQELSALSQTIAEALKQVQTIDDALGGLREQRAALDKTLHETRATLQSGQGKATSLETLQQAALRQDDQELNQWLRSHNLQQSPRLATLLQVDGGWEAAVEHVLAGVLQAPVSPEAVRPPTGPKAGAVVLADDHGAVGSDATRLSHWVRGPAVIYDFLQSVYVAQDADAAHALLPSLVAGESVVTLNGIWRGRGWVRYPKLGDAQSGVLARAQILKSLRAELSTLAVQLAGMEQSAQDQRNQLLTLEASRREAVQKLDAHRQRQAQRQSFKQSQQVRLDQVLARTGQLQAEMQTLAKQSEEQSQELRQTRVTLAELETTAQRLRQERNDLQLAQTSARDQVNRQRQLLVQASGSRNQLQVRLAGQRSAVSSLEASIADVRQRIAQQAEIHASQTQQNQAQANPLAAMQTEVAAAQAGLQTAREHLRGAREAQQAAQTPVTQAVEQLCNTELQLDSERERLQKLQLEAEGDRARADALSEQVKEAGFDLAAATAEMPEGLSTEICEEKLASTVRKIERLGAVNLAAVQDLTEASERSAYLQAQHDDLDGALNTLEDAMRKIDGETRELFKSTFDAVNTVFMDRFPKLFGGGEAYLELTENNLLETGVRVMARPPGKRNSTIQLLSGGEKAMTAVALLLALFQLNPAPFCLMDEVDAPLDDANVGRFCEIVKEMSQGVQFIIITHNKITMELANQLHGVTMQEPGVSRLVSVDVAQAVELTGSETLAT